MLTFQLDVGPGFVPRRLLGLFLLVVSTVPALGRETKTVQKTSTDPQKRAADAWIDRANTAANHGSDTTLRVQSLSGGRNQRTLVLFDLSSIPNAGIKLATLGLFMTTAPSSSRNYQARRVNGGGFWTESDVTWTTRVGSQAWGAAGGNSAAPCATCTSATGTTANVFVNWTITGDVQRWFSGTPNYGTLIRDASEGAGGAGFSAVFSSKEDSTEVNHSKLTLTFVQEVTGLTATPGNGQVTLTWSYPAAVGSVTPGEETNGVLILRRNARPSTTACPGDGTNPTVGSGLGDATVVANLTADQSSFTDTGLTNGTTVFYKVIARDKRNNYAANGDNTGCVDANFAPQVSATPGASASTQQASVWISPPQTTTLAPPGLIPGSRVVVPSNSNVVLLLNSSDGTPSAAPVATGGVISSRPPVLETIDNSVGRNITYLPNQDDLVYAIDTDTGEVVWVKNPTGLGINGFTGGAAVQLKQFSNSSFTLPHDLVVVGTHGGNTTNNIIAGLDGNTGATVWTLCKSGCTKTTTQNIDVVSSTPYVDYLSNVVYVTSRASGGTGQPSVWKISTIDGTLLGTANLNDIDSSPALTLPGDFLFVGTNSGVLQAINTATMTSTATFAPGEDAIVGDIIVFGSPIAAPYTVIFSTADHVHKVTHDGGSTFTSQWSTTIGTPSAPVAIFLVGHAYVGSDDGRLHQLDLNTGADLTRIVNTSTTTGAPSLDVTRSRVYVGSTDGRIYAFAVPY